MLLFTSQTLEDLQDKLGFSSVFNILDVCLALAAFPTFLYDPKDSPSPLMHLL